MSFAPLPGQPRRPQAAGKSPPPALLPRGPHSSEPRPHFSDSNRRPAPRAKKSGPTDHPRGKPINLEASQSDRLVCRDEYEKAPDRARFIGQFSIFSSGIFSFFHRIQQNPQGSAGNPHLVNQAAQRQAPSTQGHQKRSDRSKHSSRSARRASRPRKETSSPRRTSASPESA